MIDLRSDTVTRPTPEMREAMKNAEVGDDVFGDDPTVIRLQEMAAEMFGREAGLFVPTGSMGNQVAIKAHTKPGNEVIAEDKSHTINLELSGMAMISGVMPRTFHSPDGTFNWDLIQPNYRQPGSTHRGYTGLIIVENTHNLAGGTVTPLAQMAEICDRAHALRVPVHLDGARIFNAAAALGQSVIELTKPFDSIMFCLSKGLGAPVGSMLLGTRQFIEEARFYRKMLGGGMRQVGVLAAAGIVALEKMTTRLHEDHANAKLIAEGLAAVPGIKIDPERVQTNILVFDISGTGLTTTEFGDKLKQNGILGVGINEKEMRLVTHFDVSRSDCVQTVQTVKSILNA
ncbi:MAG TPA: GntG family PLP-dependent aldolase [Blastocatellia bacterium]|nr:GntG family PLP-dependent aldolase [Blastocatellia bacterium]